MNLFARNIFTFLNMICLQSGIVRLMYCQNNIFLKILNLREENTKLDRNWLKLCHTYSQLVCIGVGHWNKKIQPIEIAMSLAIFFGILNG